MPMSVEINLAEQKKKKKRPGSKSNVVYDGKTKPAFHDA